MRKTDTIVYLSFAILLTLLLIGLDSLKPWKIESRCIGIGKGELECFDDGNGDNPATGFDYPECVDEGDSIIFSVIRVYLVVSVRAFVVIVCAFKRLSIVVERSNDSSGSVYIVEF